MEATTTVSIKRGIINCLLKIPKISGVYQSAFEGQFLGLYFLTYVVKPIRDHPSNLVYALIFLALM
jgi:hypothetical protein